MNNFHTLILFLSLFMLGNMTFPFDYPLKPPEIRVMTPSGRFDPGAKICLSYTSFHKESWSPGWTVSTMLLGLLSFMLEDTISTGCVKTSPEVKSKFAKESLVYNQKNKYDLYFGRAIHDYRSRILSNHLANTKTTADQGPSSHKEQSFLASAALGVFFFLLILSIFSLFLISPNEDQQSTDRSHSLTK
jgi:hypothetical protein